MSTPTPLRDTRAALTDWIRSSKSLNANKTDHIPLVYQNCTFAVADGIVNNDVGDDGSLGVVEVVRRSHRSSGISQTWPAITEGRRR